MQATSSDFHGIHLRKTSIFCCLFLGSFPNFQTIAFIRATQKLDINHQTWPSDIGNLPQHSFVNPSPPKKYSTFVQLETILTQPTWAAAFSFTSFLQVPTKLGNLTWPAGVLSNRFSFQGFGVGSFELQHHISLDPGWWLKTMSTARCLCVSIILGGWLASFPFASFPKSMEMWGR